MFNVDFSSIRTVRVHKEQFDAIDNKANVVMITCVEDGRVIAFNRADSEKDKIDRLNNRIENRGVYPGGEYAYYEIKSYDECCGCKEFCDNWHEERFECMSEKCIKED